MRVCRINGVNGFRLAAPSVLNCGIPAVPGAGLAGCDRSGADWSGLDLSGADLRWANLTGVRTGGWPSILFGNEVTFGSTAVAGAVWDNTTCPNGVVQSTPCW